MRDNCCACATTLHIHAKLENQEPVVATFKLFSGAFGAIERLMQNWPIVLGVSIGTLVAVGTLLTRVLAKMRPYQLDEEEVKEERRKRQLRMSDKFSNLLQTE